MSSSARGSSGCFVLVFGVRRKWICNFSFTPNFFLINIAGGSINYWSDSFKSYEGSPKATFLYY